MTMSNQKEFELSKKKFKNVTQKKFKVESV